MRSSTYLFALGLGAAACSDTTGGGGGNTPAALTPDTFAPTYYRAVCEMLFRCPTFGDGGFAVALLQNPATCASKLPSFGVGAVADLLTFVRGGTVRFDGAAASMCIARIQRSCFGVDADFEALCSAAFRGTVVEGGACWRSDECASGFFCDHGSGTRACPGACRPSRSADASCTVDRQCAGWETGVAACVEGVCATTRDGAAAGENQGCGVLAGTPARRVSCAAGLACVTGLCRRPRDLGAPCLSIDACVPGATCALVPGTTMRTCASPAALVRSTPGGTCSNDGRTGALCNPLAHLECTAMNTCVTIGDGAMGSRCTPGNDILATTCDDGLRCDATSRRCVPRNGAGQACTRDTDCLSGECESGMCLAHVCA